MSRSLAIILVVALVTASCASSRANVATTTPTTTPESTIAAPSISPSTSTTTSSTTTSTTTTVPVVTVSGTVTDPNGQALAGVSIATDLGMHSTDINGQFTAQTVDGTITITRPAWQPLELVEATTGDTYIIEPLVVRAVRVSRYNYTERGGLDGILEVIEGTTVNALVFDTKDETGTTLYATSVETANSIGAVTEIYDPVDAIARAKEAGLYLITRLVTFEDPVWTKAEPERALAGKWIDARNPDNWEYPLGLAVEACNLGFDEIQFDYVRFPAGQTASAAPPTTQEERVTTVAAFLTEATNRLHPLGCAVSAAIFGIVTSSPTDEGIGQRPEELSVAADALSPMIYPSHYSPGWLGYEDPNDHPGPVTANALDGALSRMASGSVLRPWLQAFYYSSAQIKAAIAEAEERGLGWILWSASGSYSKKSLPALNE